MIDPNGGLIVGASKPVKPLEIKHPETGEKFSIPQVAVTLLADNITQGIIQAVTYSVTVNIVQALKNRCHFNISPSVLCGVTRVMHNLKHDFTEAPPPPENPPADPPKESADAKDAPV